MRRFGHELPVRQVLILHRGNTASMWALAHRRGFWEHREKPKEESA